MGKYEYQNYVQESLSYLNDKVTELYEAMMDRNDDDVVAICSSILEQINLIKEYHTDETLL